VAFIDFSGPGATRGVEQPTKYELAINLKTAKALSARLLEEDGRLLAT
jgi:hypothetical protein